LTAGPDDPVAGVTHRFAVRFSTGEPVKDRPTSANSFGLRGEGWVVLDADFLTLEVAGRKGPAARIPRAHVANVDYDPEHGGFVIRSSASDDYVVLWTRERADAQALWALLPQEKTPEFLLERERFERFGKAMRNADGAPVTLALIGLNLLMFVVTWFAGGEFFEFDPRLLIRLGSNFGPLAWTDEPWRLLTATFLHGGIVHLAFNLFALYQGGDLVERFYGRTRFALIYVLAALAGSVSSGWWDPGRNSVGASGAIFGIYGALLMFFALRREDFPLRLWKGIGGSALLFCGYSLALGAASPVIDNAAHIGGLLGGALAGALLVRPLTPEARAQPQPLRFVVATLAVCLPLAGMAWSVTSSAALSRARFHLQVEQFASADMRLTREQQQMMAVIVRTREEAPTVARRLRAQILLPWRQAAQPLLDAPDLPRDGSPEYRLQRAIRGYVEAKDRALSLQITALSGDPGDVEPLLRQAWETVDRRLQETTTILNEGTGTVPDESQQP
jgi:rhomboid protease GluP